MKETTQRLIDQLPSIPEGRPMLIAEPSLAEALFHDARKHRYLIPFPIKTPRELLPTISPSIILFLREEFGISPYLSVRLFPLLAALPLQKPMTSTKRISELYELRDQLVNHKILSLDHLLWMTNYTAFVLNGAVAPKRFQTITRLAITRPSSNSIAQYVADDDYAMLHAALDYIGYLLDTGVKLDDIQLIGAQDNDSLIIRRLAQSYGWTVAESNPPLLINEPGYMKYREKLVGGLFHDTVQTLVAETQGTLPEYLQVLHSLSLILSREQAQKYPDVLAFFISRATLQRPRMKNALKLSSFSQWNSFSEKTHVILIHASEEYFPQTIKDNDYLSDEEKSICGLPTSLDENKAAYTTFNQLLSTTSNLALFHANISDGNDCHPLKLKHLNRPIIDLNLTIDSLTKSFSLAMTAYRYAVDEFRRNAYGKPLWNEQERLRIAAPYITKYSPQFGGLASATQEKVMARSNILSATSLKTFSECRFRFLIEHLFPTPVNDSKFAAELGTITHATLETSFNQQMFVSPLITAEHFPTMREQTLASLFIKQLELVIEYLIENEVASKFKTMSEEQSFSFRSEFDSRFIVKGKIDKIQTYMKNENTYMVVIDYKTGATKFNEKNFRQGTDVQLLFYLNLLQHHQRYASFKIAGLYYQPLNIAGLDRTGALYADVLKDAIKLSGITLDDPALFIDYTANRTKIIGAKLKNDGTFASSRAQTVKSTEEINELGALLTTQINQAIDAIRQGHFSINPLPNNPRTHVSSSCEYCPLKHVCYLANSNEPSLEQEESDEEEELNG